MRKIEEKLVRAVRDWKSFHLDNTDFRIVSHRKGEIYLHNNCIAKVVKHPWPICGKTYIYINEISLCGWNTPTTRSRLRALGVNIRQKDFMPILDGDEISPYGWHKAKYTRTIN